MLAIPRLPLLMIAAVVLQPSVPLLIVLIGLAGWMETARVVRAEFRSLGGKGFVESARAAGAGHARVLAAASAAEHGAGGRRVGHARGRARHPPRVGAQLLRRRRPSAGRELGQHALPGAIGARHRAVAGDRARRVHSADDRFVSTETSWRNDRRRLASRSFGAREDDCARAVARTLRLIFGLTRSLGRVIAGQQQLRCAHHGAMPLVMTRSWNSRRLKRRPDRL